MDAVRGIAARAESVHVEAAGTDGGDRSRFGRDLHAPGLEVVDEELIRDAYEQ